MAHLAKMVLRDRVVLQALQEKQAKPEMLVLKGLQVRMLKEEPKENLVRKVRLAHLEHKDLRDHLVLMVKLVDRDQQDRQAHQVHLENQGRKDHQVQLENQVDQERMPNIVRAQKEVDPKSRNCWFKLKIQWYRILHNASNLCYYNGDGKLFILNWLGKDINNVIQLLLQS